MFVHDFVEPFKLKRINIDGKRYYVLDDSTHKFRSVTTVLSQKADNTGLFKWRRRVGSVEANRITTQATKRGTSVHKMAERYLLNEQNIYEKAMPPDIANFKSLKNVLDNHVNNIRGIELPLYSKFLNAAGTADLIASYDDVPSIIDFKTAKKKKKEEWIEDYFLQSTVYSMMFDRLYGTVIPQIVVIIAVDFEEPQIFVRDPRKYYLRAIEKFTQ